MKPDKLGFVLAAVSAASFGVMAVFAKYAYSLGVTVSTLLVIRFFLASLILWGIFLFGKRIKFTGKQLFALAILGSFGYGLMSYLFFLSVSLIPASMAALLLYTYPFLVTIFARLMGDDIISLKKSAALFLAFSGLILVLGVSSSLEFDLLGIFYGLGAAFFYSFFIVISNRVLKSIDPLSATACVTTSACFLHLLIGLDTGQLIFTLPIAVWITGVFMAVISTVIAIVTFYASIKIIGPAQASIISILEPVVTAILAMIIFGERFTLTQILGGILILLGIFVLQISSAKVRQAEEDLTELI